MPLIDVESIACRGPDLASQYQPSEILTLRCAKLLFAVACHAELCIFATEIALRSHTVAAGCCCLSTGERRGIRATSLMRQTNQSNCSESAVAAPTGNFR